MYAVPMCLKSEINIYLTGLDIGYVPTGPHAFLRLSGQFGPPQCFFFNVFFSASYAAIIFTANRQNSEGNVNSYLFFVIYRPNVQKCATSHVFIINSRRENIWVITCFWGASGFFGGQVDFLIHWPPGPATVQCQGLYLSYLSIILHWTEQYFQGNFTAMFLGQC